MFTDSHSILATRRKHFSKLLNVHEVDVRQTEIRTADPLVPKLSAFEVEMAIGKIKYIKHQVLMKSQQK